METEIKQLIEHNEIPNTPFMITGNQEAGYFLRMGKYRLTEIYKTEAELFKEMDKKHWEITTNLIAIMLQIHDEIKSQNNNNN